MLLAEESYAELMTSIPHILFELTYEGLTALLVYPVIRFFAKKFHRDLDAEHGVSHEDAT